MASDREHGPMDTPGHHNLHKEQILVEQVRQLYGLAPIGILATSVNAPIVFFIMKNAMPYSFLILWLSAIAVVTVLRIMLLLRFRKVELDQATAPLWAKRFLAGLAAIGAAWGSIGMFPFSDPSLAYKVFIAFALGGMAAGAASAFATVRYAFAAFGIPALAPLTLHFLLLGDIFHCAMAAMMALFGILLWRISEHNYGVNRISLLLRFENMEMIESLKKAKESVEALNSKLVAEIDAKLNAEAELRGHHEHLERIIQERTADLVAANEQLSAAKDAAEAASIAKSEFLANMSHEMRTPLAGALGMIRLVLDMKIGDEERQLMEMAERSAESLLRIITDLLDFSRLEAGMLSFEEEDFSISDVITTALEVVSLRAREKGIHLSWKVEDSVPEQVKGDAGRVLQVLVNLLGNSVKFTERGQVEVAVSLFDDPAATGQRFIRFSVRDTGEGIPADQMEQIFGKFTQIDSSLTRRHGGTGLGLALARQIVEKMGGRIWAESSVGVGSTFNFTVPVPKS